MPTETKTARAARALDVLRRLDAAMPEARIELDFQSPLQLVMAVLLSAQTTDKRVNLVTPALFRDFPTAAHLAAATPAALEPYIQSVGLFRSKAKALHALGRALVEGFDGQVPVDRQALASLPGVGPKTAGVVSMHLPGGTPAFPVDTHVLRLSRRMGFTTARDPDGVEEAMRRVVPQAWWFKGHQLLVWHGRRCCLAQRPECWRCPVGELCPRRGVPARLQVAPAERKAARRR